MPLLQLRTFTEVYRRNSLTAAAKALAMTQPAVSQHIASLEAQLGRPLFERHSRGVRPTRIADDLAASIGSRIDEAEAALASVRARSSELSGTIHIAAPAEFLAEYVARRLSPMIEAGLSLRLHIGGKDEIYDMVLSGKVQLAITASKPVDRTLAFDKVATERLIAVATPQLASARSTGDLSSFLKRVWHIAYDLDRPLIRTWLDVNALEVAELPVITVPDLRTVRELVLSGIGWSVLPDYMIGSELDDGTLIELTAPKKIPENALYLVWAKSVLRHPRVAFSRDRILDVLKSEEGA